MCPACDGLGVRHDFDPELLVPDPSLSVWDGAIAPLGPVKEMGKWRRHLFEGVAANLEADPDGPPKGTMLKGPWRDLDAKWRRAWLYGTGDRLIVHRWKNRGKVWSHAEKWAGVANELLAKYRGAAGGPIRSQLEPYMRSMTCPDCQGARLNPRARAVTVGGKTLVELGALPIGQVARFFDALAGEPAGRPDADEARRRRSTPLSRTIAEELLKEIRGRLGFLINVGLHYLTLDRAAPTLSGGEAQRIRLASQIGCGLVGVLYILDEPSIGLHPRDNDRLLATLAAARATWATPSSSSSTTRTRCARPTTSSTSAPGPASRGARSSPQGTIADLAPIAAEPDRRSTSRASSRSRSPSAQGRPTDESLTIVGARHNNLKNIDVEIPLGLFVCVTGVSGSGKSSLVSDILREALARDLNGAITEPGRARPDRRARASRQGDRHRPVADRPHAALEPGDVHQAVRPDPRPVHPAARGEGPRLHSRAGSASTSPAAAARPARGTARTGWRWTFSPTSGSPARSAQGKRFNRETLHVRFKGKSISDVLEMDVQEALEHFANIPKIAGDAADAARRRARLPQARPALADALRRRGPADQAGPRAGQEGHRQDALHPRRADDRPALRRHPQAARGAARLHRRRATPWS